VQGKVSASNDALLSLLIDPGTRSEEVLRIQLSGKNPQAGTYISLIIHAEKTGALSRVPLLGSNIRPLSPDEFRKGSTIVWLAKAVKGVCE